MAEFPITLSSLQIAGARAGQRTHICKPAFVRNSKVPAKIQSVRVGDVLWVQEEVCEAFDHRQPLNSRTHFSVDVNGRAPIPGGHKRGRWELRRYPAKSLAREDSRYTLRVIAMSLFHCQEISREIIQKETPSSFQLGGRLPRREWWQRGYGFYLPWEKNPLVVGIEFEFSRTSITGVTEPDRDEEYARIRYERTTAMAGMLEGMFPKDSDGKN